MDPYLQPDYGPALRALRRDKKLAPIIKRYGPPNLARAGSGTTIFQALLRAIVFQQLSGNAARTIHSRVVALFRRAHPSPRALLALPDPKLRACGLSMQKISYARDLAARCLDGTIREKDFPRMSSEEIIEHLVVVKGIGRWTAQMLLIFTLHRLDTLPHDDLGVRKGMQHVYRLRTLPTGKRMEEIAQPWRAYASVASWYLWEVANSLKPKRT